jgi:hypothetical protein
MERLLCAAGSAAEKRANLQVRPKTVQQLKKNEKFDTFTSGNKIF